MSLFKKDKKLGLDMMTGKDPDNYQLDDFIEDIDDSNDLISLLAIQEILDTKNTDKLQTISRIKTDQVTQFAKLSLYADTFNVPLAKDLVDNLLRLQISIKGLGRKELVQMVQRRFDNQEAHKITSKEIFKWLWGVLNE